MDLIADWVAGERVEKVTVSGFWTVGAVRSFRRRTADMARDSEFREEWRRWESLRERESGLDCLMRLNRDSAWERRLLSEDMRCEIRVSKWGESGPMMVAICSSWA